MKNPPGAPRTHLPADRAFVVQFSTGASQTDVLSGRAEHLASGQIFHFESFAHLQGFIAEVIAQVTGGGRDS